MKRTVKIQIDKEPEFINEFMKKQKIDMFKNLVDQTDFNDIKSVDNLIKAMNVSMYCWLLALKEIDTTEFKRMEQLAFAMSDHIHNELIDFIDYMKG